MVIVSIPVAVNHKVPKPHTVYCVQVDFRGNQWTVQRRYNQFHQLTDQLAASFPNEKLKMPPKKVMGNMDSTFIQKRRIELEKFLIDISQRAHIATSEHFRRFIDMQEGISNATRENEVEEEDIDHPTLPEDPNVAVIREQMRSYVLHTVVSFVAEQKISYLLQGAFFNQHSPKNKPVLRFFRLSGDRTQIQYETARPGIRPEMYTFENPTIIPTSQIKRVLVGKQVPSFAKKEEKESAKAFALELSDTTLKYPTVDLVALGSVEFTCWVDGIRAVIGVEMEQQETKQEIAALADLEVEVRMLGEPSQTLNPPPNYDFITNDCTV